MVPRRPSDSESTKPNDPSVEAAFQAVPPEMVAEILNGELHLSPHPARPTVNARTNLSALLVTAFTLAKEGPGGWVILNQPELHLGPRPDKLVPDIAGWRRVRLPRAIGGTNAPAYYDLAPDWVCEVLSERTRRIDKVQKMRIYAREGVRNVWHVDPVARTLDIFRGEGRHWLLVDSFAGDERVHAEPFEAVELELALVWSE
ncbi:Uma2 family endonuclease [Archangium minus]